MTMPQLCSLGWSRSRAGALERAAALLRGELAGACAAPHQAHVGAGRGYAHADSASGSASPSTASPCASGTPGKAQTRPARRCPAVRETVGGTILTEGTQLRIPGSEKPMCRAPPAGALGTDGTRTHSIQCRRCGRLHARRGSSSSLDPGASPGADPSSNPGMDPGAVDGRTWQSSQRLRRDEGGCRGGSSASSQSAHLYQEAEGLGLELRDKALPRRCEHRAGAVRGAARRHVDAGWGTGCADPGPAIPYTRGSSPARACGSGPCGSSRKWAPCNVPDRLGLNGLLPGLRSGLEALDPASEWD